MSHNGTSTPIELLEIVSDDQQYLGVMGYVHVLQELLLLLREAQSATEDFATVDSATISQQLEDAVRQTVPSSNGRFSSALLARMQHINHSQIRALTARRDEPFADREAFEIGGGIQEGLEVLQSLLALKKPVTPELVMYYWLMVIAGSTLCPAELRPELTTLLVKHMMPELSREKWHLASLLLKQ